MRRPVASPGRCVLNAYGAGRDALCLLGLTALAWLFHIYARVLPTTALAGCLLLATALIGAALLHRARVRRRAWLAVWVARRSRLQRWLRGGVVMGLRAMGVGAILALILLVGLTRTSATPAWLALVGSIPLLVLLRAGAFRLLRDDVTARYLSLATWRLTAALVGLALTATLIAVAYAQAYPDFSNVSLERAVWHLVDREHARSSAGSVLLQLAAAKEGLRLWLAQQLMPAPGTSLAQALGWMLALAAEAVFVWSYLLICHGILIFAGAHDRAGR